MDNGQHSWPPDVHLASTRTVLGLPHLLALLRGPLLVPWLGLGFVPFLHPRLHHHVPPSIPEQCTWLPTWQVVLPHLPPRGIPCA